MKYVILCFRHRTFPKIYMPRTDDDHCVHKLLHKQTELQVQKIGAVLIPSLKDIVVLHMKQWNL